MCSCSSCKNCFSCRKRFCISCCQRTKSSTFTSSALNKKPANYDTNSVTAYIETLSTKSSEDQKRVYANRKFKTEETYRVHLTSRNKMVFVCQGSLLSKSTLQNFTYLSWVLQHFYTFKKCFTVQLNLIT